jgi:hypothetical protein
MTDRHARGRAHGRAEPTTEDGLKRSGTGPSHVAGRSPSAAIAACVSSED